MCVYLYDFTCALFCNTIWYEYCFMQLNVHKYSSQICTLFP
jgi:hypothetical protein